VEIGMTMSAVLLNAAPLCTLTAAHFLLKEPITLRKWTALFLCMAGCVLTVTDGNLSLSGFSPYGILCGVLSGMTYGMTSIFGRMAGEKTNVWAMSTYSYLFASLFLLAYDPGVVLEAGNLSIAFAGFLYALIPTALAYVIYYKGVQKIRENSKVPVIASAETITAALLGTLFFHESLKTFQYMGMGLIFLSILLLNGKIIHVKRDREMV
jgi:drug/metabolite transporter (DMT)-like permease